MTRDSLMTLEPESIVQVLLRERLRVTALAAAVVRDVHAADDIFQQVVLAALEARAQFRELDHVRAWRLWALFDFAVWAIVGAMAFASEVGNPWAFWGLGLLLAHFAFVKWRARRWPRHL